MKKHKHKKHAHYTPAGQEPIAVRFGHLFWSLAHRLTKNVVRPTAFKQTLIVARPPKDVYAFWRDFTNLTEASDHIDSIEATGEGKTRWVVNAPFGLQLSWNAELTADEVKRRIAWKTTAPADIPHTGQVIFHGIDDGQRTELAVSVDYHMPLGPVGDILSRILGGGAQSLIEAEMECFKSAIEGSAHVADESAEAVSTSEDSSVTSDLLREARDIDTGGAISHPEHIHAADNEAVEEAKVQATEVNGHVVPKKHHKHAPVSAATAVVADQRRNLRNQH